MKTQTKHTPGPWEYDLNCDTPTVYPSNHLDQQGIIADVYGEFAQSNARLIAAAPELLNALQLTLATLERVSEQRGMFSSIQGTLDVAKAAITKAEAQT